MDAVPDTTTGEAAETESNSVTAAQKNTLIKTDTIAVTGNGETSEPAVQIQQTEPVKQKNTVEQKSQVTTIAETERKNQIKSAPQENPLTNRELSIQEKAVAQMTPAVQEGHAEEEDQIIQLKKAVSLTTAIASVIGRSY